MLLIEPHGLTSINTGFSEAIDSARASGSMAPRLQDPPKYRKDQCQSAGVFFVLYKDCFPSTTFKCMRPLGKCWGLDRTFMSHSKFDQH